MFETRILSWNNALVHHPVLIVGLPIVPSLNERTQSLSMDDALVAFSFAWWLQGSGCYFQNLGSILASFEQKILVGYKKATSPSTHRFKGTRNLVHYLE